MNSPIRTSLAGFALSCMLLCSTAPTQASTEKNIAKGVGYTAMTLIGCCSVLYSAIGLYDCYNGPRGDAILIAIMGIPPFLISGAYTAQRNIRNLIELYRQTHQYKSVKKS